MFDLVILVPIIFVIIIILLFVHRGYNMMKPELQDELFQDNAISEIALNKAGTVIDGMNFLFPMVFILAMLIIVILAISIETGPIMLFLGIIVWFIALTLAIMFSDGFSEFKVEPEFENATATYTAPIFIMDNLPYLILIMGIVIGIAIYAKTRPGGGTI